MQEDVLLVQQALSGDKLAFCRLIQKYYRSIYVQIRSLVHNHEDAEELADDVFIKAYVNLSALKQPANFFMWLRQIAWNHSRNLLRQRENNCLPLDDVYDETEANFICDSIEDRLIHQEKLDRIFEAIDILPEMDKSLMQDFYLEEMPYETLQERYKITKPAINARLIRARKRIREQLKDLFSGIMIFSSLDMAKKVFTGGLVAMKIGAKKLIVTGIVTLLISSGLGFLIWYNHQPFKEIQKPPMNQMSLTNSWKSTIKPTSDRTVLSRIADNSIEKNSKDVEKPENVKLSSSSNENQTQKESVSEFPDEIEKKYPLAVSFIKMTESQEYYDTMMSIHAERLLTCEETVEELRPLMEERTNLDNALASNTNEEERNNIQKKLDEVNLEIKEIKLKDTEKQIEFGYDELKYMIKHFANADEVWEAIDQIYYGDGGLKEKKLPPTPPEYYSMLIEHERYTGEGGFEKKVELMKEAEKRLEAKGIYDPGYDRASYVYATKYAKQ